MRSISLNPYQGFRFPLGVIQHAVWLYHCVNLSLSDVKVILASGSALRELLKLELAANSAGATGSASQPYYSQTASGSVLHRLPRPGRSCQPDIASLDASKSTGVMHEEFSTEAREGDIILRYNTNLPGWWNLQSALIGHHQSPIFPGRNPNRLAQKLKGFRFDAQRRSHLTDGIRGRLGGYRYHVRLRQLA